mmetsp:Transcript_186/g.481  ORF Transcript_186/g.481 Transcript_186/m.481 type:complete len:283 (+) Transcript_186:1241-2089(+)
MAKNTAGDATDLRQLFVADAPPRGWHAEPVGKAAGADADSLDAPLLLTRVLEKAEQHRLCQPHLILEVVQVLLPGADRVEPHDLAAGIHARHRLQRSLDVRSRRQPHVAHPLHRVAELAAGQLDGLQEARIEGRAALLLVPGRVERADARAQTRVVDVPGRILAYILLDAVVNSINGFHEIPVHPQVHRLQVCMVDRDAQNLGHDLTPKVLVHEPGARQLCVEAMAKHAVELALVVVKAQGHLVVHGAHVNDYVGLLEHLRVARPYDLRVLEAVQLAQHPAT